MPNETMVEITVHATLGELLELQKTIGGATHWSKTGELMVVAIRETAENVKKSGEQLVQAQP